MKLHLVRLFSQRVALALSLGIAAHVSAQLNPESITNPPTAAAESETSTAPPAALATEAPEITEKTSPPPQGCRPLSEKAMAADLKAVTAQSQMLELTEQARLYQEAELHWSKAVEFCEGRPKERAQRNLLETQKARSILVEKMESGPQCTAAHKDASSLQELAKTALAERRWADAATLFRKSEDMWDMASERCTGSQQDLATRKREETETDGYNAEFCAPLFAKALEQTQKMRAQAAGQTREEKQEASQLAETMWREAAQQCKGKSQDTARNNAQAVAAQRGTPWIARALAAVSAKVQSTVKSATSTPTTPVLASKPQTAVAASSLGATANDTVHTSTTNNPPELKADEFMAGTTRFIGQFARDTDGPTFSGKGKMIWANGDMFDGTLQKNQRHGKGLFIWANGQRYEGDWLNDLQTGQARVQFVDGNRYEGTVVDGVPHGQGRMVYASGDIYEGQLNSGTPQGQGLYIWKNGQQFKGEWNAGRPNGRGILKFASGNVYQGTVLDGAPHQEGTFTWTNGDKYTGQWKLGKKHGQGKFTWASGELWEGTYENDRQKTDDDTAPKE